VGTTISAEYLTPEAQPRPWTSAWLNLGRRDRAAGIDGDLRAATLLSRKATAQTWDISAGPGGTTVLLPTLYWPGWQVTLDGQPLPLAAQPGSGLMTLAVPEGEHTVTLELHRTPVRAAAEWVSLAAAVVVVGLIVLGRWRSTTDRRPPTAGWRGPLVAFVLVAAGLVALALLWRGDPRELSNGDLTWDFDQMAYLHHDTGGVGFEDGARLYEYGTSADTLTAGQTLTVTLSVDPGDGRAATLALFTPAAARPTPDGASAPLPIAAATLPLDGETVVFALPIPPDAPPGLYVPRLTLDGAQPLLPSGGTRGDLYLRPVRVTTADGRPPTADDPLAAVGGRPSAVAPTGDYDVQTLFLSLRDATTLDGRFAWYTAQPLGTRLQFSWRLQDAAGGVLAQLDAQPGLGFLPSTLWPAGQWTADWLSLRLPDAAPAEGDYPLVMRLYDPAGGQTLLTRRVGVASWRDGAWAVGLHEPSFELPVDLQPATASFGQNGETLIALPGYQLEQQVDTLRLTLYWQAAAGAPGDFTRFVHLLDASGQIVAQADGAPAGDSLATGQWQEGEVIADTVTFDLPALPAGEYRAAVGFYAPTEGLPRLDAADATGPLPDGRAILPTTIILEP
jgi:hypothetical protein